MGELRGTQIQPRDLARAMYEEGWTKALDLTTAVAVSLAESQGYEEAFNDNVVPEGKTYVGLDNKSYTEGQVWQRDCGVMQIGIAASAIGTNAETDLYHYVNNIKHGFVLYVVRGFSPWNAYDSKAYLRDTYLKRATRGVGNFLAEELLKLPTDTLHEGQPYQHELTTPVLDYYYRVSEMANEAHIGKSRLAELERNLTTTANRTRAGDVAACFGRILRWPKL